MLDRLRKVVLRFWVPLLIGLALVPNSLVLSSTDCQTVRVDGTATYVSVFFDKNGWEFATPETVEEGKVLVFKEGFDPALMAFWDKDGKPLKFFQYPLYEHGDRKRYCIK